MVLVVAEDEVGRVQTITGFKEAVPSFWQVWGVARMTPALDVQIGQFYLITEERQFPSQSQ